ncbi:signal transduction histidine kinase [Aquimarina sp. EL_43]|uniref:sensor histidine kinase n=1 Tax=Aquimarina TaxID=290174 RepID=UPI00047097A3|nr:MULTISPECIES: HAMP domain-containing sensor histidine kinase [Aquimarina]MBG6129318.1 signal transduction histidine kinase [Aquimarina sp. EL_35]MBG6150383.1 signal transduction histidine kinase [Aquimarina sp. EL_32]MBG6168309.1 signal transduction histidine kinase [Aquimarina sp. EL_43]
MKLLSLSNRYYFTGLFIVSLVGGLSSYFVIRRTVNSEFNDKLFAAKEELIDELYRHDELLSSYSLNIGDNITIQKVDNDPKIQTFIKDTILFNEYQNEQMNYRQITFSDKVRDNFYVFSITKSLLSTEDLIRGVTQVIALITALFFITMLVLSNIVSQRIWIPFYNTLSQIKDFNVKKPKPLSFSETNILEFEELNSTLELMTNQVVKDYKNLKEYTENTSHEIQTPLAIIKNKMELLMQDKNLSEQQISILGQVYESTGRLSKLKDNLSLLSKIDNNQFIDTSKLIVAEYLKKKIGRVKELLDIKNIEVTLDFKENPSIEINETMAYVLFNNLISNAIKHNIESGKIVMTLTNAYFEIKNTGEPLEISEEELFGRFKKSGNKLDSSGLGLSLVYRIADYYDFSINYKNTDIWHKVTLKF